MVDARLFGHYLFSKATKLKAIQIYIISILTRTHTQRAHENENSKIEEERKTVEDGNKGTGKQTVMLFVQHSLQHMKFYFEYKYNDNIVYI